MVESPFDHGRKEDKRRFAAATKIETLFRCYKARWTVHQKKNLKEQTDLEIRKRRKRKKDWKTIMTYTPFVLVTATRYMIHVTNKNLNPWQYRRRHWKAIKIQKVHRGWLGRRKSRRRKLNKVRYARARIRKSVILIQSVWRGKIYGRQEYARRKKKWAAITLQRYFRGWSKRYEIKLNWAVTLIQNIWRGELEQRKYRDKKSILQKIKK